MPPLREVHNTLGEAQLRGKTPAKSRAAKTNNAAAGAAGGAVRPSGTSGLKVPKLRGFAKPQATPAPRNVREEPDVGSSAGDENIPEGQAPQVPTKAKRGVARRKPASARTTDKPAQAAAKKAIEATPRPDTANIIGRRKRGQPARFGEWVEGTPAPASPTPARLPEPKNPGRGQATSDASWQPETARQEVEAIHRQMAELSEALPDFANANSNKEEAKQIPLREKLLKTWKGKTYYERLYAMNSASDQENEPEISEERVENVTDALLRLGLKSNKRKSMVAILSASTSSDSISAVEVSQASKPVVTPPVSKDGRQADKYSAPAASDQAPGAKGRGAKARPKAVAKATGKAKPDAATSARSSKDAKPSAPTAHIEEAQPSTDANLVSMVAQGAKDEPEESPIIGISYAEMADLKAELAQLRQLLDARSVDLQEAVCARDELSAELEEERAQHTKLKEEMQNMKCVAMQELEHNAGALLAGVDQLSQLARSMTSAACKLAQA